MNTSSLNEELLLHVGYVLTSACGLYDEPAAYGPFRLLDSASRLLDLMQRNGLGDGFTAELKESVDAQRWSTGEPQQQQAELEAICRRYAAELRRRLEDGGASS